MALALYRKYRPRTFAEVIGQEHVTEPLSQALRSGRLHHAYLFSGPRGCGKTSSARILARSLNCEQGPTPEPCGACGSCRSLANDGAGSIDVIEIDAASHGGVDDARELREKAFFAPASSRYKIYVIDEAHMVSSAGFNALLKLVEEPPEYVKFIFATTEPEKVLGTIRSRTHHYPFRLIPPAVLRPYLQQLAEAEGIPVEPAVFPLVVRAGGGSARDTLSVLDQLIAGAGPDGVSYARAVALLGVTDVTLIDEMCDALAAGDGAAAYSTIDRVAEAGHDARRFASDLLERFRDLIVLQQVPDAVAKGLIDGPADQLETMGAQAARLGQATLSRCADIVHNGLVEMRGTTAPRLLLELVTARMLLPAADDSAGALLQRLERMERRLALGGGGDVAPAAVESPAPMSAAPVAVDASRAADADGGAGRSAARAAAAAAARRAAAGGRPAEASPAPASAGSTGAAAGAALSPASSAPAPVAGAAPSPAPPPAPSASDSALPAAPASSAPAIGERDWNQVAAGSVPSAAPSVPVGSAAADDDPPWDEDPEPVSPAPVGRAESGGSSAQDGSAASAASPAGVAGPAASPSVQAGSAVSAASPSVQAGSAASAASPSAQGGSAAAAASASARAAAAAPPSGQAGSGAAAAPPSGQAGPGAAAAWPSGQAEPAAPAASPSGSSQPAAPAASPVRRTEPVAPVRPSEAASPARRPEPAGVLPDAPEEPGAAAVEAVAAGPGRLTAQAVRQVWPEILAEVKKQPRGVVLRAMAVDATVRELEGQTVVLTVPSARHAQGITQGAPLIVKALYEVLGGDWEIRCEVAGEAGAIQYGAAPQGGSGRGGAARGRQPARNDPAPSARSTTSAQRSTTATPAAQASSARAPQERRPAAEAPAAADDDWPEPVKPGGLAAPSGAAAVEDDEEDGWPAVRPIGVAAAGDRSRAPEKPAMEVADTAAGGDGLPGSGGGAAVGVAHEPGGAEKSGGSWGSGGQAAGASSGSGGSWGSDGQAAGAWSGPGDGAAAIGSSVPSGDVVSGPAGLHPGDAPGDAALRGQDAGAVRGADGSRGVAGAEGFLGVADTSAPPSRLPTEAAGNGPSASAAFVGAGSGPDGRGASGDVSAAAPAGLNAGAAVDGVRPAADGVGAGIGGVGAAVGRAGAAGEGLASAAGGADSTAGGLGVANAGTGAGIAGAESAGAGSTSAGGAGAGNAGTGAGGAAAGGVGAASPGASAAARAAARAAALSRSADNGSSALATGTGTAVGAGAGDAARAGRNAGPSSGLAAARAAAARGVGARQPAKPATAAWSDGTPTEEAPYDPEFDGPASGGAPQFEGFDPGDEPLDEVLDEKTARESGEQQALRLLQEALGAEKIGES